MTQKQLAYLSVTGAAAIAVLNVFASAISLAFNRSMQDGANSARGVDQATDLFGASGIFTTITNVMMFIVGAASVIMIVIGGLRYVLSGGNTANVSAAKNTILYAIVGLIVAILAYAMINFVITSFTPGPAGFGGNGTDV